MTTRCSTARRTLATLAIAAGLGTIGAAGTAGPGGAQEAPAATTTTAAPSRPAAGGAGIDVVQVEGLLDPPNARLVRESLDRAEARGSELVVFQLDSGGAIDIDVDELLARVDAATVPVVVWVGPSGADAKGAAAQLALAASRTVLAQGSGIGPLLPMRLDEPGKCPAAEPACGGIDRDDPSTRHYVERVPAAEALDAGLVDDVQPTVGDVIVSLDGATLRTAAGPVKMSTAEVVQTDDGPRRRPNQAVRFSKLSVVGQLEHTLATPWVAYFLLVAGLLLVVLEFYTASIGIAGGVGALALVGSFVGFGHLPVQWWAVALLGLGVFGLTVDVQAGGTGAWTAIGGAALVAGSVTLYGGSSRLDPSWWVVALVVAGTAVFMLGAMPAMLRARFSTPTVGRGGMIGEMGEATVDVAPDGVVRVRGALWRAHTNRATPIRAGEAVRVVAVDGILLEVEPESGGARDYRERARRR
jgi:membrane-bound serine protease (ClpP class)